AELLDAVSAAREAEQSLIDSRGRRTLLMRRIDNYRAGAQLLVQARELLEEKLRIFGPSTDEQRDELERWSRDITGLLSAHRVNALDEVGSWQAGFVKIREEVSAYELSLREAFNTRQQALRAVLTDQFNVRIDLLPLPLVFNPADPDDSYRLLKDSIGGEFERSRD